MPRAISLNFRFSVWISVLGGILALSNFSLVVPDAEAFYDPIRNNLFLVVGYLLISQIVLWYFRYRRESRTEALLMGLIFLLTAGGTVFYAMLNELPISRIFILVLVYLGISHVLFYFAPHIAADSAAERPPERKKLGFETLISVHARQKTTARKCS